jgi:hypothetical protein
MQENQAGCQKSVSITKFIMRGEEGHFVPVPPPNRSLSPLGQSSTSKFTTFNNNQHNNHQDRISSYLEPLSKRPRELLPVKQSVF